MPDGVAHNPWYPHRRASEAGLRLFCFSYAGGNAALYRTWQAQLAPDIEVVAIELPGRLSRDHEPPLTSLPQLVAALEPELTPLLDRPFAFFGYSMGALIAFELTRRLLREHGLLPRALCVAAANAPHVMRFSGPASSTLSEDELIARIERRYGALPAVILEEPELRARAARTLRADFTLLENYRHQPGDALPCPIRAFAGADDALVPARGIEAWASMSAHSFELTTLPGGHFFIHERQSDVVRALAGWLRAR